MANEKDPHNGYDKTHAGEHFLANADFLMSVLLRELQESDAQDVFHNLYIDIVTKGIPQNCANVRAYLARAAYRDILDFKRKIKTSKKHLNSYSLYNKNSQPENDPAQQLMRINLLGKAYQVIEKHQTPSVNRAYVQKIFQHLDHKQIANNLNISKETVDHYLSLGIQQIRELYDDFKAQFYEKT